MKFIEYNVNSLPVVVIDELYDIGAVERIWNEIKFYSSRNKWLPPDKTGSAVQATENGTKQLLKQNKGLYIDEVFLDRSISDILYENRKIFSQDITDKLIEINPLFRYVKHCNRDCTLLSYYENTDYYLPHIDDSTITIVSWFFDRPKKFKGGNLTFENNLEIECEFNRTVIFPSILYHSVDEISMNYEHMNKGLGRYTITQLLSYKI